MNLTQLKYFHAVCTFQTVSDAAEYLYISQPSLSNAIKELESEFGVSLFKRHHRGMALTPEGEALYKLSKDILDRAEQVESIMKDLGTERKKLRLGVPPMIGSLILPCIYRDFLAEATDAKLEIVECGRQELIKKLNEGILDMVFLPHNKPLEKKFVTAQIARLEIVCCAAKNNPVAKRSTVDIAELASTPLVLFENSFFQTEEIKKRFTSKQIAPNILLQTNQLSTMISMISNDIAVGFTFKELIGKHAGLVAVPLDEPMHVDVSLVWKTDAYFSHTMKSFKKYILRQDPFSRT